MLTLLALGLSQVRQNKVNLRRDLPKHLLYYTEVLKVSVPRSCLPPLLLRPYLNTSLYDL